MAFYFTSLEMSMFQSVYSFFSFLSSFSYFFCVWQYSCSFLMQLHFITYLLSCDDVERVCTCMYACCINHYKVESDETRRDVFIYRRVISRAYVLFCVRTEALLRSSAQFSSIQYVNAIDAVTIYIAQCNNINRDISIANSKNVQV